MAANMPVIPRQRALDDVQSAIDHYLAEQAPQAALGFIQALERAYTHLSRQPDTGSPRYAHGLQLPGLRSWPLSRYPYLVFYRVTPEHVDVWRVLHQQRDMPAWLLES